MTAKVAPAVDFGAREVRLHASTAGIKVLAGAVCTVFGWGFSQEMRTHDQDHRVAALEQQQHEEIGQLAHLVELVQAIKTDLEVVKVRVGR